MFEFRVIDVSWKKEIQKYLKGIKLIKKNTKAIELKLNRKFIHLLEVLYLCDPDPDEWMLHKL